MRILMATLALAFILSASNACAWSGAGHEVIAATAYRQLSPKLKAKVTKILQAHPDYEKWKSSFTGDAASLDLDTFVFMRASTWPDEIRRHGNHYDHPRWHYVDYPLRPPSFPAEPAPNPNDDVLYGIGQAEKILASSKTPPAERAVFLSWLIHLVGDSHQPLHCASLFTETRPSGDKGGNDFYVKPGAREVRLHSLWDGLLGTSSKPQTHLNDAIRIEADFPKTSLPELKKAKTPKDWSLESRGLAVEKAYLHGELKGATSAEDAPALPDGYTQESKTVAERQAALAGYRLAAEIEHCLKWRLRLFALN